MSHTRISRVLTVAAAVAVAAVGLITTSASANTAGAAAFGGVTVTPTTTISGAGLTSVLATPPSGAACAGDTASGGYRWDTFIASASVDPNILAFTSTGPVGNPAGTVALPLGKNGGGFSFNNATASTTGVLTPIPLFDFSYAASNIPSGVYNIGFACDNTSLPVGAVVAGQRGSDRLWWSPVTIVSAGALGVASIQFGAAASAPVLTAGATTLTSCTVNITAPAATPAATALNVTYTPTGTILAGAVTATTALTAPFAASDTKTLVTGQTYNITATQTNTFGASPVSNTIVCTPSTVVTSSVTPTPASLAISLSWTFGGTPTGYSVAAAACASGTTQFTCTLAGGTPITGSPFAFAAGVTSNNFTGLAANQLYIFSVSATYAAGTSAPAAITTAAAFGNSLVIQDLFVTRPAGALVLTQRCGVTAGMASETNVDGFGTIAQDFDSVGLDTVTHTPLVNNATLPATVITPSNNGAATSGAPTNTNLSGTGAPSLAAGATPDPAFIPSATSVGYPYPTDANGVPNATYPTHCGVNLGIAKLITGGRLAGEYFAATGRLFQVTVVDTRDIGATNDGHWNLTGSATDFSSGSDTFSADYLGWTTQVTNTSGATLAGYKQVVTVPGGGAVSAVNPSNFVGTAAGVNNVAGKGLGTSRTAASAAAGQGLGIATIDARVKLLIPLTAKSGIYTSALTFNVI